MTREQTIGLGLVAAATVVGIAAWRSRQQRVTDCDRISNRTGGSMSDPCPTEGPVDVCTFDGDYVPWRERLSLQMQAVEKLRRNMQDLNLLSESFYDAFESYTKQASGLVSQFPPAWTTEADVNPFLNQLRLGCDLLNQGNRELVRAGRSEYVVQEDPAAEAFVETSTPNLWVGPVLVAGALAGAAYLGLKLAGRV